MTSTSLATRPRAGAALARPPGHASPAGGPKTRSAARQIPLSPQLAAVLREHRSTSSFRAGDNWVFATRNGTPLSHRNVQRSALTRPARGAGLERDGSRLRFHDLRHTFASHLIIDLGLDVVQVSHLLGHASVSTTLDIYARLFDEARHAAEIHTRMAASAFAVCSTPTRTAR